MLAGNQISRGTGHSEFADWRKWLKSDHLLTQGLGESYDRTFAGRRAINARAQRGKGASEADGDLGLARLEESV
jgi:hypothetical protein